MYLSYIYPYALTLGSLVGSQSLLLRILLRLSDSRLGIMGRLILLVVSLVVAIEASMIFHGSTVTIGGASYFASPESVAQLPEALKFISQAQAVSDFVPITVVDVGGSTGDLSMLLESYLQQDDVLNQEFLQGKSSWPGEIKWHKLTRNSFIRQRNLVRL